MGADQYGGRNAIIAQEVETGCRIDVKKGQAAQTPSTKTGAMRALLLRPDGATIAQLQKATGRQEHSIRAALTEFRKRGDEVVRGKDGSGTTRYRFADVEAGS